MGQVKTTTDHEGIERWIEGRQGRPTVVKGAEDKDGEGILRLAFREPHDKLEEISWNEFLEASGDRKLAFPHRARSQNLCQHALGSTTLHFDAN